MPRKTITIILGAGASHDCREGSEIIRITPPLTKDLFNFSNLSTASYAKDFSSYSIGGEELRPELSHFSQQPTFKLEEKLREYATHPNPHIRKCFIGIPPFIRDIITKTSRLDEAGPGCYIQLLKKLIRDSDHELVFLCLNYDDLLEQALDHFQVVIRKFEDYHSSQTPIHLLKLHGSIDWFAPIGPNNLPWNELAEKVNPLTRPEKIHLQRVSKKSPNKIHSCVFNKEKVYPVITAPMAGKDLINIVCPNNLIDPTLEALEKSEKVLIIGSSGLDEDLFELINPVHPSPRLIHYVGMDDIHSIIRRFEESVSAFENAEQIRYFEEGFRKYCFSPQFDEFVNS